MQTVTEKNLNSFHAHLVLEERADNTVKKYLHDVRCFFSWLNGRPLSRSEVIAYKAHLAKTRAPSGVNAALCALNALWKFLGEEELRTKCLKVQKSMFLAEERELTKEEYLRLLTAADEERNERLCLLMQTVCSTGIRISELTFITAEAAAVGRAEIVSKGKRRTVLLPERLAASLADYAAREGIRTGPVFRTSGGLPLDRSNVWSEMKQLSKRANVPQKKIFPHALRHLFARTYYEREGDIVRLADILGHTSVNTTRIYTSESGEAHRRQLQQLGLLIC